MRTDPTFWLMARASGITAYGLLATSGLAGLVLKSRPFGRAVKGATVMDLHRFLALLALGAVALHGTTIALDRTLRMPLAGLLVPGASPYRPISVAAGVVAAELMILVLVSFPLRRLIGAKAWRRLHWTTLPRLRARHGARVAGGQRLVTAMEPRHLSRRRRRVRLRNRLARALPARTAAAGVRNRKEQLMYKIVIDGSICSGFGDCADLAPGVFELEANGKAMLRIGTSADPAVLEAAAACPMGAISVVEEDAA